MQITMYAAEHVELSTKKATYLYWPVMEHEYDRLVKLIAKGWEGKAWQLLKKFECMKKDFSIQDSTRKL